MGERVPAARSAFRGGARRVVRDENAARRFRRRGLQRCRYCCGDVRVPGEDHLGLVECARTMPVERHACSFHERGAGSSSEEAGGSAGASRCVCEPRPAFESVLAGYHKLRIRELEWRGGGCRAAGYVVADDGARCGRAHRAKLGRGCGEDPWLASCTVRGWVDRIKIFGRTKFPFTALESASFQARKEVSSQIYDVQVGTALPADWVRPARLDFT